MNCIKCFGGWPPAQPSIPTLASSAEIDGTWPPPAPAPADPPYARIVPRPLPAKAPRLGLTSWGTSCCVALPAFCVSLDSAGKVQQMFRWICSHSRQHMRCKFFMQHLSHLHNLRQGYTLSSGTCVACSLPANCASCSPSGATTCVKCNKGFYLDAANTTCFTNCLCDFATFCNTDAPSYYVTLATDGPYSGSIALCYTLCATCIDKTEFFITSIADYTLQGSTFVQNLNLATTLVLGASTSGSSITSSTASVNQQLADMIDPSRELCMFLLSIYTVLSTNTYGN